MYSSANSTSARSHKSWVLAIKNNKRVSAFLFPTLKLPLKPSFHLTAANFRNESSWSFPSVKLIEFSHYTIKMGKTKPQINPQKHFPPPQELSLIFKPGNNSNVYKQNINF